jgi:hypothetical protein
MKKFAGKTYFYLNTGHPKIWVSPDLVKYTKTNVPYIENPVEGAKVVKTKNGRYILYPYDECCTLWSVFHFVSDCEFSVEFPFPPRIEVLPYKVGNVWKGAFVSTKEDVIFVSWKRNEKRVGLAIIWVLEKPIFIPDLSSYDEFFKFIGYMARKIGWELW